MIGEKEKALNRILEENDCELEENTVVGIDTEEKLMKVLLEFGKAEIDFEYDPCTDFIPASEPHDKDEYLVTVCKRDD